MKNKIIKNCKGEIPIFVLVIGVVAICVLAIASFSISIFQVSKNFIGVDKMSSMNLFIEQYNFYKNLRKNHGEIENLFAEGIIKFDEKGNRYLYLKRVKAISLTGDDILFSVKYYLPQ